MNPINQELHNYRHAIEHYNRILREDAAIKNGEIEGDGRPLLADTDISKINLKLEGLKEKRDELLMKEKDYAEIMENTL